jgi:tetratricopeptide (TPR) repeat protein
MKHWRLAGLAALLICLLIAGYSLRAQDTARESVITHVNKSIALEAEGKNADALAEMEAITGTARNDYLVSLRLGWLSYLNARYDQAETWYRQALASTNEKSIEAMLGLTLPLAAKNQWEEIEGLYRKILKLDPEHYTANLRLGQILSNRGNFSQADKFLSTALAHYPAEYEINLAAAWNDYALGKRAAAHALFERVLMISAADTSALRGLSLTK